MVDRHPSRVYAPQHCGITCIVVNGNVMFELRGLNARLAAKNEMNEVKKNERINSNNGKYAAIVYQPFCVRCSVLAVRSNVCMCNCVNERDRMHQHQRKCKICVNKAEESVRRLLFFISL